MWTAELGLSPPWEVVLLVPGVGRSGGDGGRGRQRLGGGFLLLLETSFLDVKDFKCLSFKVSLYPLSPNLKS